MNKTKGKSIRKIWASMLAVLLIALLIMPMAVSVSAAQETPTDKWVNHVAASFAGGTGTENDPYQIATADQLALLSKNVADGNTYQGSWFKLMKDLDLSDYRWNPIGQYKWELNGTSTSHPFHGNFDGNSKTIKGLYVDEAEDGFSGGLFGYVENYTYTETVIRDITIEDAVIYGTEEGLTQGYGGILSANISANDGYGILVENVCVSGSISIHGVNGYYSSGGMVGDASRVTFNNCRVEDLTMLAVSNSGGFVGMCAECSYTDCYVSGAISGAWAMGGFVGYTTLSSNSNSDTHSTFTRCVADVNVTANNWNVGGFCGLSVGGVFEDCAALGDVKSTVTEWEPRVAGFAGRLEPYYYDSYGPYTSALNNCYFGGSVSSSHATILPSALVASVFEDYATITNCAYDKERNQDVNVVSQADGTAIASLTASAESTLDLQNKICDELYGHHQYAGNTCEVCGLEQMYINADGYWVIDGAVTTVQASGEKGDKGDTGDQGIQGEKGDKGNTGEQGIQGEKGDSGAQGIQGDKGEAGAAGVDEKNGVNGLIIAATVIGSTALVIELVFLAYTLIKKRQPS